MQIRTKLVATWWPEKPEDGEPQFLLAPLNTPDWQDVQNQIFEGPASGTAPASVVISGEGLIAAAKSIQDWRGVFDQDGNELKFSRKLVQYLPQQQLVAIAHETLRRTKLSETERKNLQSPSTVN